MPEDMLTQLRAIDPTLLTEVVRRDQGSPAFELLDWTVERLSSQGMVNPDGLFRFSGDGQVEQQIRPWSVVLKIVQKPDEEQDPRDIWYWKRELLAAQSQLLERLPGPVAAPRIYGAAEHAASGWLWMEHIRGSTTQPWTPAQYAFAARELGRFNGVYLTGVPLPTYAWLSSEQCRWWLATFERFAPDRAWENPFVSRAFPAAARSRVERLWTEKEVFLSVLNQVPQVFSHFDFMRRNLFIRAGAAGSDEVVAVDWAMVGCGALGADLYALIGDSAGMFDVEPEDVSMLEALTFEAYLAGLRDAGWQGDPALVRLGYTTWSALFHGACAPTMMAYYTAEEMDAVVWEQFGRGREGYAAGWATLCTLALDRADEARQLMARFRIGSR